MYKFPFIGTVGKRKTQIGVYRGKTLMDKKTMIKNLVREAHKKGVFTGTWLYAENGDIISKGTIGFRDSGDTLRMKEDSIWL